jgi:hypothetical protein
MLLGASGSSVSAEEELSAGKDGAGWAMAIPIEINTPSIRALYMNLLLIVVCV